MKKLFFMCTILLFVLTGCSTTTEDAMDASSQSSIFGNEIYCHYAGPALDEEFEFIQFQNDNTFIGVHYYWSINTSTKEKTDKYFLHYGTYKVDGNALTLNIGDRSYSCVLKDGHIFVENTELYPQPLDGFSDDFKNALSQ